ncbi:MAG: hypothetical protein O3A31_13145, partial [Planctomycetota bacterium]|nr:hypothetical protein [Planctomycetota bacterium]
MPTLTQLTEGKWPVFVHSSKGLVPFKFGKNPRGSYIVPVLESTGNGLAPAMGTYTSRDEDGNARKGPPVQLFEEV